MKYAIDSATLTAIADAIRAKTGLSGVVNVADMATEIANISSGSTGEKSKLAQLANGTLQEITAEDLQGATRIVDYLFNYGSFSSVEIPEGVESIGSSCFTDNGNLEYVELPSTLKTIGSYAFSFCSNISRVRVKAKTPPTMDYGCFDMATSAVFVVDDGCGDAYKSATNWSELANRIVEENQGGTGGGGSTEGNWLFKDVYISGEAEAGSLPIPVAGVSYTMFLDGEEIGTSICDEYGNVDFYTEDYRVFFRLYSGYWHFHPMDSQVQSGSVSIRING